MVVLRMKMSQLLSRKKHYLVNLGEIKMKDLLTQFDKMTLALAKDGNQIKQELTPEQAHLWHMVTGISGEAL